MDREWELGREIKLFNGSLKKARLRQGLSQRELAKRAGLSAGTISQIERMFLTPSVETAEKIAMVLGVRAEELFPRKFLKMMETRPKSQTDYAKMEQAELEWATGNTLYLEENSDPEKFAKDCEKKEIVEVLLKGLSDREKKVICMRFGLNGERRHSFDEIASFFDVSRERIRQLEHRAISKMEKMLKKSGQSSVLLQ